MEILGDSKSNYREDAMHSQGFEGGRYFGKCKSIFREGYGRHGQLMVRRSKVSPTLSSWGLEEGSVAGKNELNVVDTKDR